MTARALLQELDDRGIAIEVVGERILLRHAGPLAPDVAEQVRQHRDEILTILTPAGAPSGETEDGRLDAARDADRPAWPESARPGLIRCDVSGFERNDDIGICPACHPASWLPRDCLAPIICSLCGGCDRHAAAVSCKAPDHADS